MRCILRKLFVVSCLCVPCLALSGPSTTVLSDLGSIQKAIQAESAKLNRLAAGLDVLDEDLKHRKPEVETLLLELSLLEEKMRSIKTSIATYEGQLTRFKKLNMEFLQIEATLKGLRQQEALTQEKDEK